MSYRYQGTRIQAERLQNVRDHCPDTGAVYNLADLVDRGHVMDPSVRGSKLTTSPLLGGPQGVWIYAVDNEKVIRVAPDGTRGGVAPQVKHETLFHNADVEAAGEIYIEAGEIADINDRSGSYGTENDLSDDGAVGRRFRGALLRALNDSGAAIRLNVVGRLHD